MSATLIAAGIGAAAASAGSSVINFSSRKRAASRQFQYNKELMDLQNDYNVQNWNMQNEYNDPQNIMNRYRRAGLNPYLVADNTNAGIAGPISPTTQPSTSPDFNFGAPIDPSSMASSASSFASSYLDNEQKEINNKYAEELKALDIRFKTHQISHERYNSEMALMERNYAALTFYPRFTEFKTNIDLLVRQHKNDMAGEIQRGSALEDELGLVMTEGAQTNYYGRKDASPLDPDAAEVFSAGEYSYYDKLYRGTKDKNNNVYSYYRNMYSNMFVQSLIDAKTLSASNARAKDENLAKDIELGNKIAELQFESALRHGLKNVDWNQLLYHGLNSLGRIIEGLAPVALTKGASLLKDGIRIPTLRSRSHSDSQLYYEGTFHSSSSSPLGLPMHFNLAY